MSEARVEPMGWLLAFAILFLSGRYAARLRRDEPGTNESGARAQGAAVALASLGGWLLVSALGREDFGPGGPHVFHGALSLQWGLGVGLALWLVPALLAMKAGPMALKRRLVMLGLVAGLGAAVSGLLAVDLLNRQLDDGAPRERQLTVVDTSSSQEYRADRHYFIAVDGGEDGIIAFRTSQALHARARPGDTLVVRERPGRFGIRWIEPIE
jgi:hypothetical protein